MSFCLLCIVAFCQSFLLKRDDDNDDGTMFLYANVDYAIGQCCRRLECYV